MNRTHTVKTILDALPFIRQFYGETFVIKYGGAAQVDPILKDKFAQDVVLLSLIGIKPIIVHGGGKSITELLDKLSIKSEFKNGVRITDREALRVAEMVLRGEINSEIVTLLNDHGAKAIGLSGKDAKLMKAKSIEEFTGEVTDVNPDVLNRLMNERFIPVIAPIAASSESNHAGFNINADSAACAIAGAVRASKILFLTDTAGVLDKEKKLLKSLSKQDIENLKADGTISGGMIPKVDSALEALDKGVEKAHIIDGRIEHALILEIFTSQGIGTEITK